MSPAPGEGYAALTSDAQARLLRDVAHEGAAAFGLDVRRIGLVRHEFNTTFRVDCSDGRTVALRVNTNSVSTPEHIVAQHAWMRALAAETGVRLPVPQRAESGADHVLVPATHGDFLVVALSWLDGDDVGECGPEQARALGATMATMHHHAETWQIPDGGRLSTFSDPFFGDEDRLSGAFAGGSAEGDLVRWAVKRCREAILRAEQGSAPVAVHGDLHGDNLKWHRDELAVFDFDDCGIASPALDLAIATFYLRGSDARVEAALREGYGAVRLLPGVDPCDFEALVASRQLLLANDLLASRTSHLRSLAVEYLDRTIRRLGHWQASGHFVLDPTSAQR